MSHISRRFINCRSNNEMALVCYLTAGYPSIEKGMEYLLACAKGGADVIEIGVPFSDPIADGPVIQHTSEQALKNGVYLEEVFQMVKRFKEQSDVPIVLMGYYNPIFRMGDDMFADRARASSVDGLIVADMPFEESEELEKICSRQGIDLVQLVAPTTGEDRMRKIAKRSKGYLYLISRMGITGGSTETGSKVHDLIFKAKRNAGMLPVAVGFGIAQPSQVKDLRMAGADGAIVGTSLLRMIMDGASPAHLQEHVESLKSACRS